MPDGDVPDGGVLDGEANPATTGITRPPARTHPDAHVRDAAMAEQV